MQREAPAVAAEGIGQDDVGAGIDEGLVQREDAIGMLEVPHLRRIAGHQPHLEQIGSGRAVGEQHGLLSQEVRQTHGMSFTGWIAQGCDCAST